MKNHGETFVIGRRPIRQRLFSQPNMRERAPQRNAKGTRLKGTQLRLNSVDPAVFTHTGEGGGAGGPVQVLSVSSSSRSLTPRYALSTVSTSYLSLSSSLTRLLSRTRFKTDFLFSLFDSLIFFSLSLSSPSLSVRRRGTRSTGVCRTY